MKLVFLASLMAAAATAVMGMSPSASSSSTSTSRAERASVTKAADIPSSFKGKNGWYEEIMGLPGWDGALPSRIFSGYANLTDSKDAMTPPSPTPEVPTEMFMHYFLFLAEAEAGPDPLTAPTLVWWNGGPGATSLWGLFVELGPLLTNMESMQPKGSIPNLMKKSSKPSSSDKYIHVDASDEDALRRLYRELKGRFEGEGAAEAAIDAEEADPTADDIPRLIANPWAWTKVANILVFENPPPIGFSYCLPQGPSGNATSCGAWNDTRVGITNAETLKIVFDDHFPMFLQQEEQRLHFAGESYAGVFIGETLGWLLHKGTGHFGKVLGALESVALGDACLGGDVLCGPSNGPYDSLLFLYGHGLASVEMWDTLHAVCTMAELRNGTQSPSCTAAIAAFNKGVGEYYAYNVYDQCEDTPFSSVAAKKGRLMQAMSVVATAAGDEQQQQQKPPSPFAHKKQQSAKKRRSGEAMEKHAAFPSRSEKNHKAKAAHAKSNNVGSVSPVPPFNGYWCDAMVFFNYFDRPDVRTAIHVPLDSAFFNADNGVGMVYYYNSLTVMPAIFTLATNTDKAINKGRQVRVMWYVGDTDPSINVFAVQNAINKQMKENAHKHDLVKVQDWSQWLMGHEGTKLAAGYVTGWNPFGESTLEAFPYLSVVTVRGAGHMVAEYKPLSALTMMESFIRGIPLPGSSFLPSP